MRRSLLAAIGRNLLAVVIWYALVWTAHRIRSVGVDNPYVVDTLSVLLSVASVWIAARLNALVAIAFISTVAVTFGVEFLFHATFGYQTVQSGPVHMAVLTAALVGLLAGAFVFPRLAALRSRTA